MKLLVFDTESTDKEPERARLVSAYLGLMDERGLIGNEATYLVRPEGFTIPHEAIAVHGIANEYALKYGWRGADVLDKMARVIRQECVENGVPICGQNLVYDLTLLDREMRRHGMAARADWLLPRINVVDTYVLDRRLHPERRGTRKLVDLLHYYHLHLDSANAHDAAWDAYAAGRVALKQLEHDLLREMPWDVLTEAQALWYRDQAAEFAVRARLRGSDEKVNFDWPWIKETRHAA